MRFLTPNTKLAIIAFISLVLNVVLNLSLVGFAFYLILSTIHSVVTGFDASLLIFKLKVFTAILIVWGLHKVIYFRVRKSIQSKLGLPDVLGARGNGPIESLVDEVNEETIATKQKVAELKEKHKDNPEQLRKEMVKLLISLRGEKE
ncbi:MAG: hypothetical protein KF802_02315 [Bdellovibrionaceae bacterium]|nr:hypothetical protein [Pseudobdellovibrionaceae bacterium]